MNMHGNLILALTVYSEVFSHFQTRIQSDGSHFNHITFCLRCLHVLHHRDYPVCNYERERERLIRVSLNIVSNSPFTRERDREREREREREGGYIELG